METKDIEKNTDLDAERAKRLQKKKAKRTVTLLSIIVAVLLFVLFYIIVIPKINPSEDDDVEEEVSIAIVNYKTSDITNITYVNSSNEDSDEISLDYSSTTSTWSLATDADYPINQSLASAMATAICSLTANREINDAADLSEFGLAEPRITIKVTAANGQTFTYTVGSYNAFSKTYYVKTDSLETVYTTETNLNSPFKYDLDGLITLDTLPTLTEDNITSYTIDCPDGTSQTYTDTAVTSNLLSLTLSEWIKYGLTDEEKATMALDDNAYTITVNYTEERNMSVDDSSSSATSGTVTVDLSYTLKVGGLTDDGIGRYVMFDDSKIVYKVEATLLNALITGATTETETTPMATATA